MNNLLVIGIKSGIDQGEKTSLYSMVMIKS
jgi:hypothetical protein